MTVTSGTYALAGRWNAFGLRLWRRLSRGTNAFASPFSIATALAMLVPGARGATREQLVSLLELGVVDEDLPRRVDELLSSLAARSVSGWDIDEETGEGKPTESNVFRLHVANALFPACEFPFDAAYVETIRSAFDAGLCGLDYTQPRAAESHINAWVEEKTEGMLDGVIPAGTLDESTRLVLVNAVYFLAEWMSQFDPDRTEDAPFNRPDGSQVLVPTMRMKADLAYARDESRKLQVLELPYIETSMLVLLPDDGALDQLEDELDGEMIDSLTEALREREVSLRLPRFEMESRFELNEDLQSLGLHRAFTQDADFGGITSHPAGLLISDVLHRARIEVDEMGTEASASTAIAVAAGAAFSRPPPPVEFFVDRPFLFLIRDGTTNSILFVGRVVDPSGGATID
ncbi:MAG: serpin family protein [Planctomycetota bacterium]|nr:serpin family protein [Planctomycetota bacterium]